ncbi:MAG: oxidoreductase FAD-binding subunit [Proteobacteria bacterium]|nr:oxidoreductase FAD-binding subunit [Pseudomonadota bacterium]
MTPQIQTASGATAPLVCRDRVEETADAATFVFTAADAAPIAYKAGQFIVFCVDVDGQKLHRAYSLSSTPSRPENLTITVKRVPGGQVSNHLLDHLRPGHALAALAPAGDFNVVDRPSTGHVVLLSAGCGITPCLSIARWLLDTSPATSIDFIHSARSGDDVIAAAELDRLHAAHANFRLTRVLEQPARASDRAGLLARPLFDQLLPDLHGRTIFCCGPQPYMDAVRAFADERGFDMGYFHCESFAATSAARAAQTSAGAGQSYTLSAPTFAKSGEIASTQSLLEALESAGLPIIGACRSGVCGSCKCRVVSGEVTTTSSATLSGEEIDSGYVLACSSTARSDLVVDL